jgi:hypothetical protein
VQANTKYSLKTQTLFECSTIRVDQSIVVYILDEHNESLIGGVIPLLELGSGESTMFEPQE